MNTKKPKTKDFIMALSRMERVQDAHPFGRRFDTVFCNKTIANWFRKNAPEIHVIEKKHARRAYVFDSTSNLYKSLFRKPKMDLSFVPDFWGKSLFDLQTEINFIFNQMLDMRASELTLYRKFWIKNATS